MTRRNPTELWLRNVKPVVDDPLRLVNVSTSEAIHHGLPPLTTRYVTPVLTLSRSTSIKVYYATIASAVDLDFSSVQCWQIIFLRNNVYIFLNGSKITCSFWTSRDLYKECIYLYYVLIITFWLNFVFLCSLFLVEISFCWYWLCHLSLFLVLPQP